MWFPHGDFRLFFRFQNLACERERGRERETTSCENDKKSTGLDRFSRIPTELASESMMLAWVWTCMASVRTAFAF